MAPVRSLVFVDESYLCRDITIVRIFPVKYKTSFGDRDQYGA